MERKIFIEHSKILSNHVFRNIILEAPSISELEEKIRTYEILLAETLTSAYRLVNLNLDNDGIYHMDSSGKYRITIHMNFSGRKKEKIANPERTLKNLRQLDSMEVQNKEPLYAIRCRKTSQKTVSVSKSETFTIVVRKR